MMANAITEDLERAEKQPVTEDYGARAAFRQVKVYDWTWEGEDATEMDQASEWKKKAYANITRRSLCWCAFGVRW